MADFTLTIRSGLSVSTWSDPHTSDKPTRQNAWPDIPHRYLKVATLPQTVSIWASVGGVAGPADAALGGRLFQWAWSERGNGVPPSLVTTAGTTSKVTFQFGTDNTGHWLLLCFRDTGGAVAMPMDVELVAVPSGP